MLGLILPLWIKSCAEAELLSLFPPLFSLSPFLPPLSFFFPSPHPSPSSWSSHFFFSFSALKYRFQVGVASRRGRQLSLKRQFVTVSRGREHVGQKAEGARGTPRQSLYYGFYRNRRGRISKFRTGWFKKFQWALHSRGWPFVV